MKLLVKVIIHTRRKGMDWPWMVSSKYQRSTPPWIAATTAATAITAAIGWEKILAIVAALMRSRRLMNTTITTMMATLNKAIPKDRLGFQVRLTIWCPASQLWLESGALHEARVEPSV